MAVDTTQRDRRQFLTWLAAGGVGGALFSVRGLFAEQLLRTPRQTEGPYYPVRLPLDMDNDLLVINDNITPAVGDVIHLTGRILTPAGSPLRNATVEIWQADSTGAYIHERSNGYQNRDKNFQGFGRFETSSNGEYLFRTIKPGLYTGRTRHIHFKVKSSGNPEFTTQCYFRGEPQNENDGVLRGIRNPKERDSVIVDFARAGSPAGALQGRFDIVVG